MAKQNILEMNKVHLLKLTKHLYKQKMVINSITDTDDGAQQQNDSHDCLRFSLASDYYITYIAQYLFPNSCTESIVLKMIFSKFDQGLN